MQRRLALVLLLVVIAAQGARADYREFQRIGVDPSIGARINRAAETSLTQFPKLKREDLAITVVDLTNPKLPARADFQGDAPFYPASVIKLFLMADTFAQHKENLPDVPRALHEMIVVSDNDATAYVIDTISNTTSGPSLEGRKLRKFEDARRQINRDISKWGYDMVSAMLKPWSFGPFGRDMQVMGPNRENRNRATTNAVASLMLWIVNRRAVSKEASDAMMALLERPLSPPRPDENQVKTFFGESLPATAKLWSKAGDTSEVRHDAAYVELADGHKYVIVIFTRGQAMDMTLLPGIGKNLLAELAQ